MTMALEPRKNITMQRADAIHALRLYLKGPSV